MACEAHPSTKQATCSACKVDIRAAKNSPRALTIRDACGCVWRRAVESSFYIAVCAEHRGRTISNVDYVPGFCGVH